MGPESEALADWMAGEMGHPRIQAPPGLQVYFVAFCNAHVQSDVYLSMSRRTGNSSYTSRCNQMCLTNPTSTR